MSDAVVLGWLIFKRQLGSNSILMHRQGNGAAPARSCSGVVAAPRSALCNPYCRTKRSKSMPKAASSGTWACSEPKGSREAASSGLNLGNVLTPAFAVISSGCTGLYSQLCGL